MKRFESRTCTFAVPDDWEPLPPFGFAGPGEEEDRLEAQALERWLPSPVSAAAHAKRQLELLPGMYEEMALVQEGAHTSGGPGEGHFLFFRFENEEGDRALAKVIYLAHGPLVCELTLTGLDGPDRERDRLFEAIGKTFTLKDVDFLDKVSPAPLLSEVIRPPAGGAPWPGGRHKFPRCCVSLPLPSGWEVAEEDGTVIFRRRDAEIRLRRLLDSDGDVGAWRTRKMQHLQDTQSLVLGSEQGEVEAAEYAAVLYEEKGAARRWTTAAIQRTLDIFWSGEQPLLWRLEAPATSFRDYQPLLESLAAAAAFLPPEEWELKLPEPWVDLTLRGPWRTEGSGVYVNPEPTFLAVYLVAQKADKPLGKLQPSLVQSVRDGAGLQEIYSEEETLGLWRGRAALHYSVEGFTDEDHVQGVRTVWTLAAETLYGGVIWGIDSLKVEKLHRQVVDALRLP